ncbi:hypothetical protein GCM10028805_12760 [Spirosoma harenae]
MPSPTPQLRIAILGGGPSALFTYKRLIESDRNDLHVHIFERSAQLGAGMPYSMAGANVEHVTNVSGNEIPNLITSLPEWIKTQPVERLALFQLDPRQISPYQVVPRLLFGQYLSAQFDLLQQRARARGLDTQVHLNCTVSDIRNEPTSQTVWIETADKHRYSFDIVIVCTGHYWPISHEGTVPGYFDSPYPPTKLALTLNHPVAIRGASLTAIDAIRTLARHNGHFEPDSTGQLRYYRSKAVPDFQLVMHSRQGLLPAIRFHLDEPLISQDDQLSPDLIAANRQQNQGFLSLDFVFEKAFKQALRKKDPVFYERIRDMDLETFVDTMMGMREHQDPFVLFAKEYQQAEQSIKQRESIHWKETLAVLSYALNYPAKYFSAEDSERLKKVLMPLIAIVIAFVPQQSAQELLALYQAGILTLKTAGEDSKVTPHPEGGATYDNPEDTDQPQPVHYQTFVDCIGQPHLAFEEFPFKTLVRDQTVSRARLRYQSDEVGLKAMQQGNGDVEQLADGKFYLTVPGLAINDDFQVIDPQGQPNPRLYIMAVPHIGGYNPDYSGLDFAEAASTRIVKHLLQIDRTVNESIAS